MVTRNRTVVDLESRPSDCHLVTLTELQLLSDGLHDNPSSDWYRNDSTQWMAAKEDLVVIEMFLKEYAHSPHTLRNYAKECMRYLLWALLVARKPISSVNADDIYAFEHFLRRPPNTWCQPRVKKDHPDYKPFAIRLRDQSLNPDWRPFQGPLSEASVKVALATLKSLHAYLHDAQFTEHQWSLLQETISNLPDGTDRQRKLKMRSHYIIAVFYFLGLRISESVSATMGDFYRDLDQRWWLTITGTGLKKRDIPVPTAMLRVLHDYRLVVLDASPLPHTSEITPMISSMVGNQSLTANRIHKIVKTLFAQTAINLDDNSQDNAADKQLFDTSTTYWLRHTYATNLIEKGANARTVQLNLGHGSINTTMIYEYKGDAKRHIETDALFNQEA